MITVIVGHRGTGKSSFIRRLRLYFDQTPTQFVDLDQEIETKIGRSIPELFLEHGEDYFRDLERQVFLELIQGEHPRTFISVGAGFDLEVIPDNCEVLWLRRETDADGRIFLDRPRLNPEVSPLEEFRRRADIREALFRRKATWTYTLPEGIFDFKNQAVALEKTIVLGLPSETGGVLTLLPIHMQSEMAWLRLRERMGGKKILFELRDDFLSREQIERVLAELPTESFIYSFRGEFAPGTTPPNCAYYDWPLEKGNPKDFCAQVPAEKRIFSLHEMLPGEDLAGALSRLENWEKEAAFLKFSPAIEKFEDLEMILDWQARDAKRRNILPRSVQGRWTWVRQWMKGRQRLNFWREGDGSAVDQPTLFQWLATPTETGAFAAVFGDPVRHSFTPLEQQDFFAKRKAPVFAIRIGREEWDAALPLLKKCGLVWAAVTSPHKENAARLVSEGSLRALNTLIWTGTKWRGVSTDEEGFLELIEGIGALAPLQSQIAVWGGGGTLEMLRHALPRAIFYESRTAKPREEQTVIADYGPKVLIWAAPRSEATLWPPSEWRPEMVVDLNYKEDSMGREYAQKGGLNYQSGLQMFVAQARAQRAFWAKEERESP